MRRGVVILLFLAGALPALGQRMAIAPRFSTMGGGADLVLRATDGLHVRLGAQAYSLTRDLETSDIEYEGEADLSTQHALLDIYPGGGGFRVTLGAVINGNELTARSTEDTIVVVNGVPYRVADVGVLTAEAVPDDLNPYASVGWGNPFRGGRVKLMIDIGAFYQGEPEVELRANPNPGVILPPGFEENLAAEERELQEEVSDYRVYPVVSVGVAFRF
jgi:hypothetical protein